MTADTEPVAVWSMRLAAEHRVTRLQTLVALTAAHDEGLTREAARRRAEQILRERAARG